MNASMGKSFKGFKKADTKTGGILAGLFAGAGGALSLSKIDHTVNRAHQTPHTTTSHTPDI